MLQPIKKPGKVAMMSYCGDLQGVGTIRIIYPTLLLNHLRIPGYQFQASYGIHYINDPMFYKNFTFVQFQRAATDPHLEMVRHFKKVIRNSTKTPVIYEIDDLLFDIPEWNYASSFYAKYRKTIESIMSEVDGIIVSTEFLKEQYSKFNVKVAVIPNHLPKFVWGDIVPQHTIEKKGKVRIVWAGSENHFANKNLIDKGIRGGDFGPGLIHFIKLTVDQYDWIICGGYPDELSHLKNNGIKYYGWRNIFEYPSFIKSLQPDIMIAPLQNNDFNRAKSNLKMLEAVAVGAAGIYSNVEPYKGAMMLANTDEEMVEMIYQAAKDIDLRRKIFEHDLQVVDEVLYWEKNENLQKYIETYLRFFNRCLDVDS